MRPWRKNHAHTRTVRALPNRGKSFVHLVAERQGQATPVTVPIRGAAVRVSRPRFVLSISFPERDRPTKPHTRNEPNPSHTLRNGFGYSFT
jgi:hypothetical protein